MIEVIDRDEPVRLPVHERLQQHRVDDAEDRRVGANAEAERENHDGRKGGALEEAAERVAKIAHGARG